LKTSTRAQALIAVVLLFLMVATRGHHVADVLNLPDASWAVFFLAGFYLRSRWAAPGLLAVAAGVDFAAVTWGGVNAFCISPAYSFLVPAYGSLWLAGRWYAGRYRPVWTTLPLLAAVLLSGAVLCELFSSGGFYVFSGRFTDLSVAEFGARFLRYFPSALPALAGYVGLAAVLHAVIMPVLAARRPESA